MTKVLLTNCVSPRHGTSPFFNLEKYPPIGISYLSACLKKEGVKVDFVDNYVKAIDMRKYILETKPDFVGISVNTICWTEFLKMFDTIKDLDVKFICGGPHPTLMPESLPMEVDHIVIGEGEKAIVDIVKGKVNTRVVCYPPVENLDELPDPDYTIFENVKYNERMEFLSGKTMSLNTSRGCPMQCTFCGVRYIWGNTYRFLSAERVVRQIKKLMNTYGVKSFYIREDNFTLNRERVEKFCELVKSLNIEWATESRIDNLDIEILKKMAEANCKGLYIGTESGNDRVLKLMKKGITVKMIREKVSLIRSLGIKVMASWLINIPGETDKEIADTFALAKELGCEINNMNIFTGMPKSELYDYMLKEKCYSKIDNNFMVYPIGYQKWAKQAYGFVPTDSIVEGIENG